MAVLKELGYTAAPDADTEADSAETGAGQITEFGGIMSNPTLAKNAGGRRTRPPPQHRTHNRNRRRIRNGLLARPSLY